MSFGGAAAWTLITPESCEDVLYRRKVFSPSFSVGSSNKSSLLVEGFQTFDSSLAFMLDSLDMNSQFSSQVLLIRNLKKSILPFGVLPSCSPLLAERVTHWHVACVERCLDSKTYFLPITCPPAIIVNQTLTNGDHTTGTRLPP